MSVLGRVVLSSAQRLDLADLKSVDSFVGGDFKYLIKSFVGDARPYILKGFEVINPGDLIGSQAKVSIKVADSVVYYPGSNSGSFFYGLPEGNPLSQPLLIDLKKNATNYIYLTLDTTDTAADSRAFWDPDKNGGEGGEYSQVVNTQSALVATISSSVSTFPANTIPVCKIKLDGTGVIQIEDCRDMMFRLGTGGITPAPYSTYAFKSLPSAPYARMEPSTVMTSGSDPNPFQGGDKNINSLKEWMDAVMTKLLELGGTPYWYSYSSSISVASVFQDTLGSMLKSKGQWLHDASIAGKITWTSDIYYKSLIDPRDIIIRAGNITVANERIAFIPLVRGDYINSGPTGVDWTNSFNYVNGIFGAFQNLSKGDWVKKKDDPDNMYLRVEEFYAAVNGGGGPTTAASAQSILLSSAYTGLSQNGVQTVYTKGEYTSASIQVVDRNNPVLAAAGGNMMWLAARSDSLMNASSIQSYQLLGDIVDNDGVKARFESIAHGLQTGDRITIAGSVNHDGTYQVEVEGPDSFMIAVTNPNNEANVDAFFALVTTASRTNGFSFITETAEHGLENNELAWISATTNYNGSYEVSVRSTISFQIPVGSLLATETAGAVSATKVEVRKSFGATKIVQGESVDIGEEDGENIQRFIGMNSLSETHPMYAVPSGYNTLAGQQNFNSSANDSLTSRVSKLTAMMADRIQDRGMRILGKTIIRNTTNLLMQDITASTTVVIERPNSGADTVNLACSLPENSAAVVTISRDTPGALSVSVESLGSAFLLAENKLVLLYRLSGSTVYTWTSQAIAAGASYTANSDETTQNKNISVYYPGAMELDLNTDVLTFSDPIQDMVITIPGSTNSNTIDTSVINGLGGMTLLDGYSIWARVHRTAAKVFNIIQTSDIEDSVAAGALNVTLTSVVPTEQDVFVLFTRIGNALIGQHKPDVLKENVYEETLEVISGAPSSDHEIAGPVPSGTILTLPSDLRDSGNPQYYVVGAGHLEIFLNGQRLIESVDWNPQGTPGTIEQQIEILQTLEIGDRVTYRDSGNGGVYFANSAPLSFTMQDTYDAGRFITTLVGQPVVINGPVGEKLLQINGDIGITGLVDPTGITFIPQTVDPMESTDKGLWVGTDDKLRFKKSSTETINVVDDFVRVDGTHSMAADLNLNNNSITNLADPVDPQDAATKAHVSSEITALSGAYLALDGSNAMTGDINANTNKVINVVDPIDLQDAATKSYTDSLVGGLITSLPSNYLKLDGSNSMSNSLNVNSNRVINVAAPTTGLDAANRDYVDSLDRKRGVFVKVTNNTGATTLAGTTVRLSSVANEIQLASSNSLALAEGTVGVVYADILDGAQGDVQISGEAFVRSATNFDIGKRSYVAPTAGLATSIAPVASGTVVFFLGVASAVDKIILSPNLDAINDNVYDEDWVVLSDLPSGTVVSLPTDTRNGGAIQTYTVGEGLLEIFLNGQYLNLYDDWSEIGSAGDASTTILMNQALISNDKLTFRINVHNSAYFMSAGSGGSLQTSYNNGRFISVSSGAPVEISGPIGEKLFRVLGDIEVTGVVDPKGITFTPEVTNPLPLDKAGLWINSSGELMSQKGDMSSPANVTVALDAVTSSDSLSSLMFNNTGLTIGKGTPVTIDTNGNIVEVDVSIEDCLSIIGIAKEDINDGAYGLVTTSGSLKGIITTAGMGSILYVAKDGLMTNTKPSTGVDGFISGDFVIRLGVLVKDSDNPSQKNLVVNIQVVGQL